MATIYLRDGGDLTLIVGEGEEKSRYVVCRRTICGVCKSWNAMFTKFSEAFAPEVELPDDNPQAILILLQIAHLRFDQLPGGAMSLQELNRLAIVCDKYDAVATVRPFLKTWLSKATWAHHDPGNEQYLWVHWVFGKKEEFSSMALALQLRICTNEDGQCLTEGGAVLDENMQPNIIEKMLEIRQASIDSLLAVCYTYIDQVEKDGTCKEGASKMKEQCYLLTLGSVVHSFRALDIWKPRRTGACVHQSVASFYKAVKGVKISTLQEAVPTVGREDYSYNRQAMPINHDGCNLRSRMMADLEKVYKAVPTPVQDFQLERISQQAKKGVPLSPEKS